MSAKNARTGGRLFSIRNLLLVVTALLMLVVIGLNIAQMSRALTAKDIATRAQVLNETIDNIVQLKLALADERLFSYAAYGFAGEVPSFFTTRINMNRSVVEDAYNNIQHDLERLPPFDGDQSGERYKVAVNELKEIQAQFAEAHKEYTAQHELTDTDLESFGKENDQSRGRDAAKSMDAVIELAAALRIGIESNYDFGDDRIGTVNRLKNQLWVMSEYASREAASLSDNVAGNSFIGANEQSTGIKYSGISQGAWGQIVTFAKSGTATREIADQVQAIETTFIEEFGGSRFDLYDASAMAEEDEEDSVTYDLSAEEWVTLAQEATKPVFLMSSHADNLAKSLNDSAVDSANASVVTASVLIAVSFIVGGLALWVVMVRVVRPVNALSATMMVLADGNLDVDIPSTNSTDEVGDMAKSVQIFKDNAIERRELEAEQRENEERERSRREEEEERTRQEREEQRAREEIRADKGRAERRQSMLDLADKFEQSVMALVEGVSTSANGMEHAASGMSETAADTSQQSEAVANAAQQASSNAQMVASAAEELSSSVREITGQTNQSSAAARDAVTRTDNASKDVAQLVEAAEKIGEVVKLINEIAEQTNLLALNATIEAARAGDAGRGFAVVASEVKSLANQTAKATQEISDQVSGMQNATNLAVNAMDEIKGIIGDIEATSVSIASAVEEQDASTQEIARNVSEVSTGTEEVTSNIHTVNQGATTTGQAAAEVLTAAQTLTQQSDDLRGQVVDFLKTIRA